MIDWEEISQTLRCVTCGENAQMLADDELSELVEVRCLTCNTSVTGTETVEMLIGLRDHYIAQAQRFRLGLRHTQPDSSFTDPRWPFTLEVIANPLQG